MIDKKLLDILACPLSKAPLVVHDGKLVSTDPETRRAYRIEDGIPIMLIEEGEELSAEAHQEILKQHGTKAFQKKKKVSKKHEAST